MKTGKWISGLADLVLPRYCAVCGRTLLLKERHLCLECAKDMPLTYFWTMKLNPMSDRFNSRIPDGRHFAVALFLYRGKYRNLTKGVKYRGDVRLGRYLGAALGRKIASCEWMNDVDVVVPVPLHFTRKLRRGYNQAQVIAEAVAGELGRESCRLDTDVLFRRKRTASQARLRMSQKAENVAGAFLADFGKTEKRPVHVLLVDDVFTSGSTLVECQTALRRALVEKFGKEGTETCISVATLAFVGD